MIPRYNPQHGGMQQNQSGNYVSASDYDKQTKLITDLLKSFAHYAKMVEMQEATAREAFVTLVSTARMLSSEDLIDDEIKAIIERMTNDGKANGTEFIH